MTIMMTARRHHPLDGRKHWKWAMLKSTTYAIYLYVYICIYIKNSLTYKLMILFTRTVIFKIYMYIITRNSN